MVVLEGYGPRAARTLRRAGFAVRRFRAVPSLERAELLLPLGRGAAPGYAVGSASPRRRRAPGGRRPLRAAALGGRRATLASTRHRRSSGPGPPCLVAAAAGLGLDPAGDWFVTLGRHHVRSRSAFHIFAPGGSTPAWVVKFGRLAAARDRFDRETRGLEIAAQVGAVAAGHAPRPLGRFEVDGLPASLETAAVGDPLDAHLAARRPRAAKLATIESIARLASHRRHGVGPHRAARGRAALPGA